MPLNHIGSNPGFLGTNGLHHRVVSVTLLGANGADGQDTMIQCRGLTRILYYFILTLLTGLSHLT